jgi:hypothetical protein
MTEFCGVDVPLGEEGLSLFVDGNSKITRDNGTFLDPTPNALSLPHVTSCPGATPTCAGSCYVHGLRRAKPELWAKYASNLETIKKITAAGLSGYDPDIFMMRAHAFGEWIREHCPGGFRWHVSGDLISSRHARLVRAVVGASPSVRHWIYTRSFDYLGGLHDSVFWEETPSNLTINLSADRDNYDAALQVHDVFGCRICYLVDESGEVPAGLPDGSVLFPDYSLRGRDLVAQGRNSVRAPWWQSLTQRQRRMVCPADYFGQSESRRCGPCDKCLVSAR